MELICPNHMYLYTPEFIEALEDHFMCPIQEITYRTELRGFEYLGADYSGVSNQFLKA